MKIQNPSSLILYVLIPLAVGSFSALLSGTGNTTAFIQPSFAPPAVLFPIVWTVLYILMGISSYLIFRSSNPSKSAALKVYALQLLFNFFWSILFFRLDAYLPAFLWLIIMIVLIVIMIYQFYQISPLAAYLQLPYLVWCLFAAVLNLAIYQLN